MTISSGVSHRPVYFDTGGVPNIVQFGIRKAARNRQGTHCDGAKKRTHPQFIAF